MVNTFSIGHRTIPVQGYLAHKKTPRPLEDPTVGLCLGSEGGPREVGVSYERGTPVGGTKIPRS